MANGLATSGDFFSKCDEFTSYGVSRLKGTIGGEYAEEAVSGADFSDDYKLDQHNMFKKSKLYVSTSPVDNLQTETSTKNELGSAASLTDVSKKENLAAFGSKIKLKFEPDSKKAMFHESSRINDTINYDQLYEIAKEKDQQNTVHPDEPIIICQLEDIEENLEGDYGRVKMFNDIIYLKSESDVHCNAKALILVEINKSLPKTVRKIYYDAPMRVPIYNKYACGSIQFKYPDFNFFKENDIENLVLVGEIVFRHETEKQMLLESINYLTEYTPIQLVIVVQLPRHFYNGFSMRIILVNRSVDFDPNKRKHLKSELKKGEKKFDECIKNDFPLSILDLKKSNSHAAQFNVKPIEIFEYSEDEYSQEKPFEFEIPGSVFDYPDPILITIRFETIQKIKLEWEEHTNTHP